MVTATEKIVQAPVTLTSGAIKQLKLIYEKEGIAPENGLRIGVKGGGCSGFSTSGAAFSGVNGNPV